MEPDSPTPSAEQVIEQALMRAGKGGVRDGGTGEIMSNRATAAKATRRVLDNLAEAGVSLVRTEELQLLEFGARHGANAIREGLVEEEPDTGLRERVASRIHWAIGGWIMGPWEQVTHEGQRNIVYRAADAAIAAGVKEEEQLTAEEAEAVAVFLERFMRSSNRQGEPFKSALAKLRRRGESDA